MCGIICHIRSHNRLDQVSSLEENIKNRGPDYYGTKELEFNEFWKGFFSASILHTQGKELAKQPFVNSENDVLLWNGDIFAGSLISGVDPNLSDTEILFNWLQENDRIFELPTTIEGPYSFVYFNNKRNELWFGRDPLGRHSLLWSASNDEILISSVGHKSIETLEELPAIGIFCLQFSQNSMTELYLYQWSYVPKFLLSFDFHFPTHFEPHIYEDVIETIALEAAESPTSSCESLYAEYTDFDDVLRVMDKLLENMVIKSKVEKLILHLKNACRKRVIIRKNVCKTCENENSCSSDHAKLGILFSGGLDSTIIAYFADKFVPTGEPIDLLNVAFHRNGNFEVPDRRTGLMSLEELRLLCPERKWNFVEINVPDTELENARKNHVCHLIYPLETILDDSLGCALWFACKGQGTVNYCSYTSSAKILLLGNGADEQLGGYTRHRNILRRNGWQILGEQLLKETLEISKRNLGRDDRIACDSGRQPRFPFLDEQFVEYISNLPPWEKCGPISFPKGLGEKLILRLAAVKLGLRRCATFPKRAFQFGCRIAKSKEKGDDRSDRL